MAVDDILFEQFAVALNRELASVGATVRVDPTAPPPPGTMVLRRADGRALGTLPDHVDARTILAFEAILLAPEGERQRR